LYGFGLRFKARGSRRWGRWGTLSQAIHDSSNWYSRAAFGVKSGDALLISTMN